MKRNAPKTDMGNRSARPEPHCSHRNLGRGADGICGYGRRSNNVSTRTLVSLVSSVVGEILQLADRSIRRLSTGLTNSNLRIDSTRQSAANLPDKQLRGADVGRVQDATRRLPQNNDESELIADKQK